ncbi:immunoglobulin-like domain-containing protein, partial [Paenibacillus sp. FJAT-27812]|uniref:immunoglobulin-like domain-containing protein n=1 Tax=Paenibacillus sp. FJAT-27812 TaxID=1684143 RepID=UPI002F3E91CE
FDVTVIKETSFNDAESVAADKAALGIVYSGVDTATTVTQKLTLPLTGTNGTTITWSSGNTAVIAANGTVNRPANAFGDASVTLTATITKNGTTEQRTFNLTVLKNVLTSAPIGSDIMVTNNVTGQDDLILVSNLQAGDIVKVYSSTGNLLKTATVASGATSASLQITQLGAAAGTVKITVTRAGFEESAKVIAAFAAENAKPYVISGTGLDTKNGIEAKVTVTPTEGLTYSGSKYVIFELMNGDTPVSIIALEYDGKSASTLTAQFNTAFTKDHKVNVLIMDQINTATDNVGTPLADKIVLSK